MILRFSGRLQPAAVESVATLKLWWFPKRPAPHRDVATSPRDLAKIGWYVNASDVVSVFPDNQLISGYLLSIVPVMRAGSSVSDDCKAEVRRHRPVS